jgi:hypothetical protein
MNESPISPLPGYILDTHKEYSPGFVSKSRKARNAAIAKKKKKLAEDIASGKAKIDKPTSEYDTVDQFGRAMHVEWRGGGGFYSRGC